MQVAVKNRASHVKHGGRLVVEPWVSKEIYLRRPMRSIQKPVFVTGSETKVARMIDTNVRGLLGDDIPLSLREQPGCSVLL
jgi:hypothetical protein